MTASAFVTLETALGSFTVELYGEQAPLTTANFLAYVDSGRYDGSSFFRIVNPSIQGSKGPDSIRVIVGGTRPLSASNFPRVALETTLQTGLAHRNGTLSLGREDEPDSGEGEFFVCIGDHPQLDHGGTRHSDGLGFAAFGQVCTGMDVVEAICSNAQLQEYLTAKTEVTIVRAYRVAGGA